MKLDLRDRVQIVIFAYETGVNRPAVRSWDVVRRTRWLSPLRANRTLASRAHCDSRQEPMPALLLVVQGSRLMHVPRRASFPRKQRCHVLGSRLVLVLGGRTAVWVQTLALIEVQRTRPPA